MMLDMRLGETRRIKCRVTSSVGDAFTILSPSWALMLHGTVEETGIPVMDEHEMSVLLSPQNRGVYALQFSFGVADEIIIKSIGINVTG